MTPEVIRFDTVFKDPNSLKSALVARIFLFFRVLLNLFSIQSKNSSSKINLDFIVNKFLSFDSLLKNKIFSILTFIVINSFF